MKYHPKIEFTAKNWFDICNFYSKVIIIIIIIIIILSKKICFTFYCSCESLLFHNNIKKFSEQLNKQNLLKKSASQVTYPA